MSVRKASHAFSWYEGNASKLRSQFKVWLEDVKLGDQYMSSKALIGPHAGYSYSGKTAAWAYKALEGRNM